MEREKRADLHLLAQRTMCSVHRLRPALSDLLWLSYLLAQRTQGSQIVAGTAFGRNCGALSAVQTGEAAVVHCEEDRFD